MVTVVAFNDAFQPLSDSVNRFMQALTQLCLDSLQRCSHALTSARFMRASSGFGRTHKFRRVRPDLKVVEFDGNRLSAERYLSKQVFAFFHRSRPVSSSP